MGLSREQAVREALRYTTWPHAMCGAFVQRVFGWGWVGASAIDAWNRAQHKHTDFPPPPGVPCYWGPKGHNPYGHIAVSLGGGKCRSSDYPGSGRVGTVDIRWIEQHWPNTGRYLGWSEDIAGHVIPGGGGAAPAHEEDDMTPEQARQLQAVYDAIFNGGSSMPEGKPLKDLVADGIHDLQTRVDALKP